MAKVLVIGSGGREHVLAWKLAQSGEVDAVYVAPGNDGMLDVAECVDARDVEGWLRAARDLEPDLVVIGPEAPLVLGLADRLREQGHVVFGPSAQAAQLEGDKAFAKDFLQSAGIPTAESRTFDDLQAALDHVESHPGPCVVKATGLAAGKGVSVCDDAEQARRALATMMGDRAFGSAGETVLVEERLEGPELSVFAVVADDRYAWFAASRDHKRLREADRGPNTGGMGAYTPVADAGADLVAAIDREVLAPSVAELGRRGLRYRGLLYVGLMLTAEGPKVLEYNCRFGDPETQVVLPTFDGDLYSLLSDAAQGRLSRTGELPMRGAAVGIVLAAGGYPAAPRKGDPIHGLESLAEDALVFHAGVRHQEGTWVTNGGRVLCAVGRSADLSAARRRAESFARTIRFEGAQWRRDIGKQEEKGSTA